MAIIHHLRKSGNEKVNVFERMRGSSDLWAWRDCLIALEETDADTVAKCQLQHRDETAAPPFLVERIKDTQQRTVVLNYIPVTDTEEFREFYTEAASMISTYRQQNGKGPSVDRLAKDLGGRKQDTRKQIWALIRSGKLTYSNSELGLVNSIQPGK